ncbi:MAG: LLM class flavin-dependent oxidoreductase [Chloroflexota bacterium]|nr:MAG: LLM class flavin-dependent oxidoreductase [Chloroflexota bacterium]
MGWPERRRRSPDRRRRARPRPHLRPGRPLRRRGAPDPGNVPEPAPGVVRPSDHPGPRPPRRRVTDQGPVRFGAQLWSQATDWPAFRDAGLAAEAGGWDSVWTWDHLLAIFGPWQQPILEGWMALAGLAPITRRVRLGLMVGANTFRNPGHTAKLAATLDQLSDGRAVMGIGGAWFEREHEAFGIDLGASVGARLDWLDESVGLIRRLLDGELVSHEGRHYTFRDALCEPRPIQAHLPILVGGSGPTKTLRTIALRADGWNTNGTVEEVTTKLATLDRHCAEVGRDRSEIELTVSFPVVLRDRRADAEAAWAGIIGHNGVANAGNVPHLLGSPAEVADEIRPYVELGFRTIIVRLPAPHDRETIDRIGEVASRLEDA